MSRLSNRVRIAALCLAYMPTSSLFAATVYFFPASFDGGGEAPVNVSNRSDFPPLCGEGTGSGLPGMDLVRRFNGAATCPTNSGSGRLSESVDYVFLVDDTSPLSSYLMTQFRQKNLLQQAEGRQTVRPGVVEFPAQGGRPGLRILVAGEIAYQQAGSDTTAWLAALNGRFDPGAIVAGNETGGADDDIWLTYHGTFYNRRMEPLEDVSMAKIAEYFSAKLQQVPQGTGGGAAAPPAPSAAAPAPPPGRRLNDYMRQCNSAGVPLPPIWNPQSGTNQWQRRGTLSDPAASQSVPKVEVWVYDSSAPQGVCFALPRMKEPGNIDNDIRLLGVICQSETSGRACFWDNVERPTPEVGSGQTDERLRRPGPFPPIRITGAATQGLDPADMRDGYNVAENCTDCHRGSNVFLIQANTSLDVESQAPRLDISPSARYQPISGTPPSLVWINPPSNVQAQLNDVQCSACHDTFADNNISNEIPTVTSQYCATVLENFIGTSMPPSSPANWQANFREEVTVLANACCNEGFNMKYLASNPAACPRPPP